MTVQPMIEARTGNALTSGSPEAVRLYNEAIDLILGSQSGAARTLDRALELDSRFALAAAARYYVEKDSGGAGAGRYRALALDSAAAASEWEREHVAVLFALLDEAGKNLDKARAYIRKTPGDLFVISQLAGHLIFHGGRDKLHAVLDLFESVENALQDDWAYLARLGFAASEAGDRRRGRELLERALGIHPQSLYTIHALAHLLHDEGAAEESARVLRELAEFEETSREGHMYSHVQWHLALAEWQTGARDAALARYEQFCAPGTTTCGPVLALADCAGFLLRDYLAGGETRALPADVLQHIERVWPMIAHPFVALNVAGLYASAGDTGGLQRCRKAILDSPPGANRELSLGLVTALTDFAAGDYARCARTLASVSAPARVGIGGSNVERTLVSLIEERSLQ